MNDLEEFRKQLQACVDEKLGLLNYPLLLAITEEALAGRQAWDNEDEEYEIYKKARERTDALLKG
jgi:hypothetical protein